MMRVTVVAAVICLAAVGAAAAGDVRAAVREPMTIAPQSLGTALQELARDRDFQLICNADLVRGLATRGISGRFTPGEALTTLLAGTGLTYRYLDATTVTVVPLELKSYGAGSARPPNGPSPPTASDTGTKEGKRNSSGGFRMAQKDHIQPSANPSMTTPAQLEEVVVTAQKREERLIDVPVPVTALNAATLAEVGQLRLQDYYASVPGLSLTPDDNGGAFLAIRGITTGYGTNPTVGITIDDVPYGASATAGNALMSVAPDLDPSELAQVEVLRGPQGTLYGAASMGGLLKFVTVDPSTDRLKGQVQIGTSSVYNGSKAGYDVNASINAPLSSTVAVRASGFTRQDAGYIDNIATGQRGINEEEFYGGRLSALWRPDDAFSLKLSAFIQDSEANGSSYSTMGLRDLQQDNLIGTGIFDRKIQGYSANIHAKLGGLDFVSVTGYSSTTSSDDIDLGPAGFAPLTLAQFGVSGTAELDNFEIRKFTQEIRLSSLGNRWLDWLAGGFYDHENTPIQTTIAAEDSTTGTIAGQWLYTDFPTTFQEYAAFADLTVHVTRRFDVQVGGRESYDEESIAQTFNGVYDPVFLTEASPVVLPRVSSNNSAFTYLLTPRLRLSSDWMIYARLASGYRPGGPNDSPDVPREFAPDKTENYEIGTKGEVLNRRVSVDASAYYIEWRHIQLSVYDPQTFLSYVGNASGAKSEGVELALGARPAAGLSINGWVTLNEAVLTTALPPNDFSYGMAGDRLPYSSRFSGNLALNYEFPLSSHVSGFAGAATSYIGGRYGIFTGLSQPRQFFPAYAKTDLQAGLRFDAWALHIYANNVADKRGVLTGGQGTDFPNALYYIQPRVVGLSLSMTF